MADNALMRTGRRPWQTGDFPEAPMRGIDGGMYGPGYSADPGGGGDSSLSQQLYESGWLDNIVKLHDAGRLHPAVEEMLRPAMEAMQKSQHARDKEYDEMGYSTRGNPIRRPGQ